MVEERLLAEPWRDWMSVVVIAERMPEMVWEMRCEGGSEPRSSIAKTTMTMAVLVGPETPSEDCRFVSSSPSQVDSMYLLIPISVQWAFGGPPRQRYTSSLIMRFLPAMAASAAGRRQVRIHEDSRGS